MRNDINLMPKRDRVISAKMMFLIIIISMSGILLMGFCGLYLPLREKSRLKNIIEQKQEELLSYSGVEVTYFTLSEQVNKIKTINSAFETLKTNNLKMTRIFQDFQENIPGEIIFQNISYSNSNGELLVEGLSPTYKMIAQYIVKLRQLDYILGVEFTSAEIETPVAEMNPVTNPGLGTTGSVYENKDIVMQKFSIKISLKTYNSTITVPNLPEGDITDEKGGE